MGRFAISILEWLSEMIEALSAGVAVYTRQLWKNVEQIK